MVTLRSRRRASALITFNQKNHNLCVFHFAKQLLPANATDEEPAAELPPDYSSLTLIDPCVGIEFVDEICEGSFGNSNYRVLNRGGRATLFLQLNRWTKALCRKGAHGSDTWETGD